MRPFRFVFMWFDHRFARCAAWNPFDFNTKHITQTFPFCLQYGNYTYFQETTTWKIGTKETSVNYWCITFFFSLSLSLWIVRATVRSNGCRFRMCHNIVIKKKHIDGKGAMERKRGRTALALLSPSLPTSSSLPFTFEPNVWQKHLLNVWQINDSQRIKDEKNWEKKDKKKKCLKNHDLLGWPADATRWTCCAHLLATKLAYVYIVHVYWVGRCVCARVCWFHLHNLNKLWKSLLTWRPVLFR